MHLPDHLLSEPVCMATAAGAAALLGSAALRLGEPARGGRAPLAAALGGGIFAAQMLNFPVGDGASVHLLGSAAAAALLGPSSAMLVLAAVVAVQALVFGDGGAMALGANLLNMALAAPIVASAVMAGTRAKRHPLLASAAAGAASVLAAVSLCGVELIASGRASAIDLLPALLGAHLPLALAEAFFTAAVVALTQSSPRATAWVAGLAAVAALASPLASSLPDGLESVVDGIGLAEGIAGWPAPLADYALPGIGSAALATLLAAMVGTLTVAAGVWSASLIARAPGHALSRTARRLIGR